MDGYKLSHTAQEVDELLDKAKSGVCLPVVELTTVLSAEGAVLSEEESAAVQAAFDTGMPCVIKYTFSDGTVVTKTSALFIHSQLTLNGSEHLMYGMSDGGSIYRFALTDGTWVFLSEQLG